MRRKVLMAMAAGFAVFLSGAVFAEEVKISTYYPSPYGNYKNLETTDDTSLATTGGSVGVGMAADAAAATLDVNGDIRAATTLRVNGVTINGTGFALNEVLTSDASGNATWEPSVARYS